MNRLKTAISKLPMLFFVFSIFWRFGKYLAIILRILGARRVGVDEFENGLLVLNRASSLGKRGDLITTPQDLTIFKYIIENGEWEADESRFLAKRLLEIEAQSSDNSRVVFVDIGANSGLVTRQVLQLSESKCHLVLVEPIPNHVKAIEANLGQFRAANQLKIVEAALGITTGENEISIEISNRGNSSFLSSAMPASGINRMRVKTLSVDVFYQTFLLDFDNYIIKSDTQGFDSKILSLIPDVVWEKCGGAVIEVWALPEIELSDVEMLLKKWKFFSNFNWAADGSAPTNLKEIGTFWLNKTGRSRNLFLS